mmetsp:Transcript_20596/g.62015  ORF Transcript_20596/g.62015 Transcript_20596/m.62015 type:complete len:283 (+) Transcript_20596:273-1121(+)
MRMRIFGFGKSAAGDLTLDHKHRRGPLIGNGYHGNVFTDKACDTHAIKVVILTKDTRNTAEDEARIHSGLAHPNIVQYHQHIMTNDALYISMERLQGGTVGDALRRQERISTINIWRVGLALGRALNYMHQRNLVHLDVRCRNILLGSAGSSYKSIKLGDFGSSRRLGPDGRAPCDIKFVANAAPEMNANPPWSSKASDMWALGCVLYTLASGGNRPFGECDHPRLNEKVREGEHKLLSNQISQALRKLVEGRLLQVDARIRATAQEVVNICTDELYRLKAP